MPFPPKNRGDAYLSLLEGLGGSANVPKVEACTVCGHPVWRSDLHAHRACLEGRVSGSLGYAPPTPVRPDPIVGLVYAKRLADASVSQVSDRTGAANERRARDEVARMAPCRVCHRPLTCGQSGVHHSCKSTDQPKETL